MLTRNGIRPRSLRTRRLGSSSHVDSRVSLDALRAAGPGLTKAAVQRNYSVGESEYWRPFLKLLAHEPEQWVESSKLYNSLGLQDRQCAGMLGAAERRCKGFPPYVKSDENGQYYFWMPKDVAILVGEFATP